MPLTPEDQAALDDRFEALEEQIRRLKRKSNADPRIPLLATNFDVEDAIFNTYRARSQRAAAQTMVKSTFDVIEFDTEDYDPSGDMDVATTWDYTVPVTGRYLVTAAATITMATAGKLAMLSIFVDGVEASRGVRFEAHSAMFAGVSVTDVLELTVAEKVDIRIFHDEASDADLSADPESNRFAVHALSL